ncbi:MAG: MATE family efflux transporter [Bacteroidales bacterium]|nr:MATE family efflux transporter [Bacteroidales bacterium]
MNTKSDTLKGQLKSLTTPIFIEIALVMLLGAVDTVMLSHLEVNSDNAVAAVGVDNQIISLVFLIYQFISMGAAIVCAQYIGAGLKKRLVQVVGIAVIINLLVGLSVSAFIFFNAQSLLDLMGLRPELMDDGLKYLKITGSFSFFQAVSLAFSASLRSANLAKYPMRITLIVNLVNILGNYALIFGHFGLPALGVEGAAYSTSVSRFVSMVLLIIVHTKKHIGKFPLEYFRPFPWKELKNVLKIGIPAAGEELSYCSSQVVITYFINKLGNDALTARTLCANAIMFVNLFVCSIVQGGDILVGHLVGQNKNAAAYTMGNYIFKWAMLITLIVSFTLALLGNTLLQFLTQNPEIIRVGTVIFFIDVVLSIGRVSNIFAVGTLRSTGDAIFPVLIGISFQWVIAVGFSYFLGIPMGFGLIGMWIGFACDENLRGIVLMKRWHSLKWQGKNVI